MLGKFKSLKKLFLADEGISLIEVLAAVLVLVVVSGALIGLGVSNITRSTASKNKTTAFELLKEGIEAVRMIRDNVNNYSGVSHLWGVQNEAGGWSSWDWSEISDSGETDYYYFESLGEGVNKGWRLNYCEDSGRANPENNCYLIGEEIDQISFYRQVKILDYGGESTSKKVEVLVGWKEKGEKFKSVSSSTILTNWEQE